MGRRSSAFSGALDELDSLDDLPRPTPRTGGVTQPAAPASTPQVTAVTKPAASPRPGAATRPRSVPVREPAAAGTTGSARIGGTRATQVRLPPELAGWLSAEAHRSGRTFASVVALAAKAQEQALPLEPPDRDDSALDVARRTASATVPITLRLNGAQRELLDNLAAEHTTTRSAIVVAALRASCGDALPPAIPAT